jgi:hypothetical protein
MYENDDVLENGNGSRTFPLVHSLIPANMITEYAILYSFQRVGTYFFSTVLIMDLYRYIQLFGVK